MTEHVDPLEDDYTLPDRNQRDRDDRVKQIIAETRAFLRGEGRNGG